MGRSGLGFAASFAALLYAGSALAQSGEGSGPDSTVPKLVAPETSATDQPGKPAKPPKVAGTFGQWALLCNDPKKEEKRRCSLVQALVEQASQQLVFRLVVANAPKDRLLLKIDGPTGIALQKGLEFSPDGERVYRIPFHTCVPKGCSAMSPIEDELKQDLLKAEKGTITVYALDGQPVRALAQLGGFAEGLAALEKSRAKP
jgi:invasion protein IalB